MKKTWQRNNPHHREQRVRRAWLEEHGIDPLLVTAWAAKWNSLRGHCKQSGKGCTLTFYEYVSLAIEAGFTDPSFIGPKSNSMQLARIGDTGPYSVGNCRFITKRENLLEKIPNGGTERGAMKLRGKPNLSPNGNRYLLTSPDGTTYCGRSTLDFCSLFPQASQPGLDMLLKGKIKCGKHKGWTGRYLDQEEYEAIKANPGEIIIIPERWERLQQEA